jgi:hypothetical protein
LTLARTAAERSTRAPARVDCRKGGVDFPLGGFVSPHGVHFAGDPEDIDTHYDDMVLRPLADMVMAKLP